MVERQFSERATRDIAEVVRHFKRNGGQQTSNSPMPPGRYRPMEGKLTSALSSTEGSTATFDVWSVIDGTWEATGESYTITNHSGGISGAVGDYVLVASVSGKLRPILVVDSDGDVNGGGSAANNNDACGCGDCVEGGSVTGCSACSEASQFMLLVFDDESTVELEVTGTPADCEWESASVTYGGETSTWVLDLSTSTLTHGTKVWDTNDTLDCLCAINVRITNMSDVDPQHRNSVSCTICIRSIIDNEGCCTNRLPNSLTVTVSASGTWSCCDGDTFSIYWNDSTKSWRGDWEINAACSCEVDDQCMTLDFSCGSSESSANDFRFGDVDPSPSGCDCDIVSGDLTPNVGASCDPLLVSYDKTMSCNSCGSGTLLFTVTE